ncbi:MAG: hypothetical protein M3N04_00410, partial [Actinomycetota bacterium]|nr:hypothetical protein [Actinomycetota bacterium]
MSVGITTCERVVGRALEHVGDVLRHSGFELEVLVDVGVEAVEALEQDVEIVARDDDRLDAQVGEHREV